MKGEIDDQLDCSGATDGMLAAADFNGAEDGNLDCSCGHTGGTVGGFVRENRRLAA
jgi:hypothetical protein